MLRTFPAGDPSAAIWIDLIRPEPAEIETVRRATGLRVPTETQISEIESSSRLAFENGAYYLSAPIGAVGRDGDHSLMPLGFAFSARVLLTVSFSSLPSIEAAAEQAAEQPPKTAEEALLHIFELIVDRAADHLEHAGAESDDLSRAAFHNGKQKRKRPTGTSVALRRIGEVAHKTSRIRDELLGLGRIGAYLAEGKIEGAPPVNAGRIKAIRADIASLTEYEAHLSNKVQFLLDATLGFINIEQNEIVKILTIASVVGIPPVLIAGIYGMNFRVMPELKWVFGYPMALALMVITGLLPLWWFRRRGWL
ncbi:MAG: magnesium transporter CorA family protein [Polyangia bacterium]